MSDWLHNLPLVWMSLVGYWGQSGTTEIYGIPALSTALWDG